jgi:hypothetical protein
MRGALPAGAAGEDVKVDAELSFLDGYVKTALDNGAKSYNPPKEDASSENEEKQKEGRVRFVAFGLLVWN